MLLPFGDIAEGLGAAGEALGLAPKVAAGVGQVATGLATGYAGDVSSNLAKGQTGASIAKPGLGTVIGGGLAGAGLAGAGLYDHFLGDQKAVENVTQAYSDAAGSTKTGIRNMSKTAARGLQDNPSFLANAGIPPETEEINGRRVFTTGADSQSQQTVQSRLSALTNLRDQAIEASNGTSNLEDLRQAALAKANTEVSGTARDAVQNHINEEFDAYKAQYGKAGTDEVSLPDMNAIKKDLQAKTNYDATRPSIVTQANKMMANLAKTQVETDATKAGTPAIGELNKVIQQHIDSLDFLNKINGQTVKGGRIGSYIAKGAGAVVGARIGHAVGGGALGELLGTLGGEQAGGAVSKFLQSLAAGGSSSAGTLGRMASEDPQVVRQFLQYIGSEGGKVAPVVQPSTQGATGLLQRLLNASPGSVALH